MPRRWSRRAFTWGPGSRPRSPPFRFGPCRSSAPGGRRGSVVVGGALPGLAVAATLAAASMAGLPPLVGFVGKEAAFEGFLHGGAADTAVEIGLVLGATLTAAYSARLLWGAFARKPDRDATEVRRP